jgi:low affinity Fe/Cu permease
LAETEGRNGKRSGRGRASNGDGRHRSRKPSGSGNGQRRESDDQTFADRFRVVSTAITQAVGTPWALLAAAFVVLVWAVTGPLFGFSDTWQLVINTGTTIVTFLMVFAIQNSQNRESKAIHLKLDELIRSHPKARDRLMMEEEAPEKDVQRDEEAMKRRARQRQRAGR